MKKILSRTLISLFAITAILASSASYAGTKVLFKTNKGNFVMELDDAKAPTTVNNFLNYVKSGFYSGTIFHRVINGFMVQGGGFTKDMRQKPTSAPIPIESKNGLKNEKYTVAMARTSDPNSATAQFFVNVKNNGMLDYPGSDGYGYTVFGKVISGTEVIDEIKFAPTTNKNGMGDVPIDPIVIESATIQN
jgi:peptidyl-prolyl cis-trans isomerase A (cyclophilin A)